MDEFTAVRIWRSTKTLLDRLADDDKRTISMTLDILVKREIERRQQPRTLVDSSGRYEYAAVPGRYEEEPTNG